MDLGKLAVRLASNAADLTASSHGIPGAGPVVEALLNDLLALQDEQAKTLARIERDVKRIIAGPWRTARIHLQHSLLPGQTVEEMQSSRREAARYLMEAVGMQEGFGAAYANFDLAVVLYSLGDVRRGDHHAREALGEATAAVQEFHDQIYAQVLADLDTPSLVRGIRKVTEFFRPAEPREDCRHWLQLAIAVERLVGPEYVRREVRRLPSVSRSLIGLYLKDHADIVELDKHHVLDIPDFER
ncbi:MAG: hypothetical protein LCH60_15675 [Actinobacteria bacterium]|nr:hypothetical protein [Actinomycetota bacterium]